MHEIVMLSGKGGTGKTSITAAFATLAGESVLVDCDVDAADLHLILQPKIREKHEFTGGQSAWIDPGKCLKCGLCSEACRFGAILRSGEGPDCSVDEAACEGCGVCAEICQCGAVVMRDVPNGHWFKSETRAGPMLHARLRPGGENSGRLVSLIRDQARRTARERGLELIITDGPPGIGCPAIASLAGASHVVIVTEPTVSGIHDLQRAVGLASHFRIPVSIIINKCDINPVKEEDIYAFAQAEGVGVLGSIPYDPEVTCAQLAGLSITEYSDSPAAGLLGEIWEHLADRTTKLKDLGDKSKC